MSVLSPVYSPAWIDLLERQRAHVVGRLFNRARYAMAARLGQWAQAVAQREAQRLREAAADVGAYDARLAADWQALADRHEWAAR